MADEDTPEENDVEAEMMRMMQEELSGDDAGGGSDDDSALAEMAAALGDGDGDEGGNIDEMLEQEMLKAMQSDTGEATDAGLGALPAFGGAAAAPVETPDGIERLADVDVNVTVELGGVSLEVKDIMQWTRDSIVELEAQETDLVDIMVNGKLFAKGEVVVVQDTFGVRIVELVDPIIEPSFRDR